MSVICRRVCLGAALAAGAALAVTGCSATTAGTATGSTTRTTRGCAATGYTAAAATATVRCYLDALRAGDTETACEQLSVHARARLLAGVRDSELQGLINPSAPSSGCATVAPAIQRVLDSLTSDQRAELDHELRTARSARLGSPGPRRCWYACPPGIRRGRRWCGVW